MIQKEVKMNKGVKNGNLCSKCGICKFCNWVLPIIVLILALVPGWLQTTWAKWVLVLIAILILLKNWCPCPK